MNLITNSQQPTIGGDHLLEDNYSNQTETLTVNSKFEKIGKYSSSFYMLVGIFLLTLGAFSSKNLLANGLEGLAFCIIALGFSLIYYGVSEDNK